jgi:hypothetical protein
MSESQKRRRQTELQRIAGLQNWNLAALKGMSVRLNSIAGNTMGISKETAKDLQLIRRDIKSVSDLLRVEYDMYREEVRGLRS